MRARRRFIVGLFGAAAIGLASCVSAPVELHGKPSGSLTLPLQGVYKATVRAPYIGPISARLTAAPSKDGFTANSRPGVAWEMIGGVQGLLGQVFVPFLFPGGVILTWTSGLPDSGSPGEGWIGIGGIKSARARTLIHDPNEPIDLVSPEGHRAAIMTLEPCPNDNAPFADYKALGANIEKAVRKRLYDPELVESSSVRSFLRQVRSSSAIARDDVEFIFGEAIAARNNTKLPMPIAVRRPDGQAKRLETDANELATVHAIWNPRTEIAVVKVEAFFESADVDRAFQQVLDWHAKGLLLDIRTCPGVRLSSFRAACWLYDHPTDAGFFFGQSRRAEALAGNVDGFPRAELDSAEAVEKAEALLDAKGAAAVIVEPEKRVFDGPVAVLISKRTTTSAEPLAWLLKNTGRARLFGSTTVGRPMVSRPSDIGQGWDFWLSAFDYKPPTGPQFNDKGVEPDEEVSSKERMQGTAMRWLRMMIRERAQESAS